MEKVLFIGLGHMGSALVKGIGKSKLKNIEIYGYNRDISKTQNLAGSVPQLKILKNLEELEKLEITTIVIGVRPIDFENLCRDLNKFRLENKTIISMVNAIKIKQMEEQFPKQKNVGYVRIMPNMNAAIQESTTAIAAQNVSEQKTKLIKQMFESCGTVVEIPETKFSTFAAIAGCLPSYVFTFYKAVVEYAQNHDFNHEQAMKIIGETIVGSVHNAQKSEESLTKMIQQICVPNGSTIEGQKVLEENDFEDIVQKALKAANDKA